MTPLTYDQYCRAVTQANVQFILTRRALAPWWHSFVQAQPTAVQFGSDGGASIADGVVSDPDYVLIGRHHPSDAEIFINGQQVFPQEIVLLPPGGRFIFACNGPRTWLAVTVPRSMIEAIGCVREPLRLVIAENLACIIPIAAETERLLIAQAEILRHEMEGAQHERVSDAASLLVGTARSILSRDGISVRAPIENLKSNVVVTRALEALHQLDTFDDWYIEDLARAVGVHPRTLLRAFQRVLRMSPMQYLHCRQLNQIRKQLCAGGQSRTVTDAMQSVGASDLGRISGAYKALFGESPSETLRAARLLDGA